MKKSLFRIALSKLLYVILFVSIQVAALVVMFLLQLRIWKQAGFFISI